MAKHPTRDEVLDVLREIAAEVRTDAKLGPQIRDDLEVLGVERLAPSCCSRSAISARLCAT